MKRFVKVKVQTERVSMVNWVEPWQHSYENLLSNEYLALHPGFISDYQISQRQ